MSKAVKLFCWLIPSLFTPVIDNVTKPASVLPPLTTPPISNPEPPKWTVTSSVKPVLTEPTTAVAASSKTPEVITTGSPTL